MNVIQTIRERSSTRSYLPVPLDQSLCEDIERFCASLIPPFGARARISLVHTKMAGGAAKLGTYGVVSGASDFLVLSYRPGPMAAQAAACLFEQVVLHCTALGLGTCWMGATFSPADFAQAIGLKESEVLRIVSPVGYKARRRTLMDAAFGAVTRHTRREAYGKLFFDGAWGVPLDAQAAGPYAMPLEMVRLAPSARNLQPWRIVKEGNALHLYCKTEASRFTDVDMGIAMCHLALACGEPDVPGAFGVLPAPPVECPPEFAYTVTWA